MLPERWEEQRKVLVDGLGGLGVMIIGEAPGETEQATGKPFHSSAPAGMVLAKAIKRMGWRRDQFYITNIVDRRPPKNWLEGAPWEREMIEASRERLDEEIGRLKPRAIVTLGGTATRELTGLSGKKLSVSHLRGYVLASRYGIPVIPTFHPSYLARGQSKLFGLMMNDLAKAVGVANGQVKGPATDPSIEMECRTGLDALLDLYRQALSDPSLMIAYDIETDGSVEENEDEVMEFSRDIGEDSGEGDEASEDEAGDSGGTDRGGDSPASALDIEKSTIRTVQFAICKEWGVSIPWDAGHRELIDKVLQLPNLKAGHNTENFDRPKLLREGSTVNGEEDDTLLMWRAIQPDLPGHLQAVAGAFSFPFPWKHMAGANIEFYGVADVCAIHYIYPKLRQQLERAKLWHGYREMTLGFRRAVIEPMERRGLPVSKAKLDELREWLTVEVDRMRGEIEGLAPSELNKVEVYSNLPQMIKEFVLERHPDYFAPTVKQRKNGLIVEVKSKLKVMDLYKEMMEDVEGPFVETRIEVYHQWPRLVPVETEKGWRMAWVEPFNPQSSKQMLAYLRLRGYKIPTRFKDGVATTGDKEMERLERETKDPIIKLSREMRVTDKLRGSYTGKLGEDGIARGGWIPGPDGRVRATFTFKSTGQLAASNPNVLTLPVRRKELAARFRSCIEAEPGHKIVEIDMAAFHAKTTGLEARDLTYMRLANLDIHSYVAGWMVKWPGIETALGLPDDELSKVLDEIKANHRDVRNYQAKPCIAEGEMVLTDKGLVPIENIALEHKLWDGIEWVSHDGVICTGTKEVMDYDGLKATPDHQVFTKDGRRIPIRQAAYEMVGIETTGIDGESIRTGHRYFREDSTPERLHRDKVSMPDLWQEDLDKQGESPKRKESWLSVLFNYYLETLRSVRQEIRWYGSEVSSQAESCLQALWRKGDRDEIQISQGIYPMGREEPSSRKLSGSRDRQNKQRWPLRAGEFTSGDSTGAGQQPPQYRKDLVERRDDFTRPFQVSLRKILDNAIGEEGHDWGRDSSISFDSEGQADEGMGENRAETHRVRVYDILNAGPRHRFTVSGKLVSNCILGIGFAMSYRRLYFENRDYFANEAEAKKLLDLIKRLFPKVFKWQEDVLELADRQGYLQSRWGNRRWFWDVYSWSQRGGQWTKKKGRDAEKAIAFLPATDAHYMLRKKLIDMSMKGWLEKYQLTNIVHDSLVFHCPTSLVEECIELVKAELESPVIELADPVVAPDGFSCRAEASFGDNWSKEEMREV